MSSKKPDNTIQEVSQKPVATQKPLSCSYSIEIYTFPIELVFQFFFNQLKSQFILISFLSADDFKRAISNHATINKWNYKQFGPHQYQKQANMPDPNILRKSKRKKKTELNSNKCENVKLVFWKCVKMNCPTIGREHRGIYLAHVPHFPFSIPLS